MEIYFSILQRKALRLNDFATLEALKARLHGFGRYCESIARPFKWKFARADLRLLLNRIDRARAADQRLPIAA